MSLVDFIKNFMIRTLSWIVLDGPDGVKEGSRRSEMRKQCDKGGRNWNGEP